MYADTSSAATDASPGPCRRWPTPSATAASWSMLTAYDASFARALDAAGVDLVLVGDSLGMVVQGHDSTLPVTVDDIAYHTACVARGLRKALLIADLPFQADATPERALDASTQLLQAGAAMVKLEGAGHKLDVIRFLVEREIPVCAHLGLTPQSVLRLGGYKVQGRDEAAAAQAARRRARRRRSRRRAAGARMRAVAARRGDHRATSPFPPSASAPARIATARCWCCTTCSASTPAIAGRGSSRISSPKAARSPARCRPIAARGARRPLPRRRALPTH